MHLSIYPLFSPSFCTEVNWRIDRQTDCWSRRAQLGQVKCDHCCCCCCCALEISPACLLPSFFSRSQQKDEGRNTLQKTDREVGGRRKRSERQMKTLAACLEIAHGKRHTRSTLDNLPENSNQTEHAASFSHFSDFFLLSSFSSVLFFSWCSPATRW